ncbi:(Fe-S)-binding protein [Archaeoglobales archaeon]|nr:MAG: (Fe-S)-binding protein [Archaeoglobales archaeon]
MELDPKFARSIIKLGGESLKKCYQCATCSVICPMSPDDNPFPRKEMIWAQWGVKDRLLKDVDVWLCHHCNDCSEYCPRGAKPGEVLAALRAAQVQTYSWPSFIAKIFSHPASFILFLAIPAILIYAVLQYAQANLGWGYIPEGEIIMSNFIPHIYIELAGFVVGGFVGLVSLISIYRFWNAITEGAGKVYDIEAIDDMEMEIKTRKGFWQVFLTALWEILTHKRFKDCGTSNYRYFAHLMIFYGFILLGISTLGAVVYLQMGKELALPPSDPVKVLGNIGFVLLFAGMTWVIFKRFTDTERLGFGSYFDWFFLIILYLVVISGIAIEAARLAGSTSAYYIYLAHLVFVFTLLTYAPYSKFAHLLYRSIAYVYSESTGRKVEES